MDMQTLQIILQITNTAGVIGLLALNVWAFYTGKVLPRSIVDEMIKNTLDSTKTLATEITNGIEAAVRNAIVSASVQVAIQKKYDRDQG